MTGESYLLLGEDIQILRNKAYKRKVAHISCYITLFILLVILFNYFHTPSYTYVVRRNIKELLERTDVINYQPLNGSIRPFYNIYSIYPVVKNYNLAACYTPKVMATTLNGIFCYLAKTELFKKRNLNMKTIYWQSKFCEVHRPVASNTAKLTDYSDHKLRKFVIYRHPIARFVSAFVNKCVNELDKKRRKNETIKICFDCDDNLECVVKKSYEVAMSLSRGETFYPQLSWDTSYAFVHFSPESWDCDISRQYQDFNFIKYGSSGNTKKQMSADIMNLLEDSGVEKWKLDEIRPVISDDKPLTHATRGSELPGKLMEQIYNSPELLDILTKLYYYDFKLFGFPMPKLGELPPHGL